MEKRHIGDKPAQPYRTSWFYAVASEWFFLYEKQMTKGRLLIN